MRQRGCQTWAIMAMIVIVVVLAGLLALSWIPGMGRGRGWHGRRWERGPWHGECPWCPNRGSMMGWGVPGMIIAGGFLGLGASALTLIGIFALLYWRKQRREEDEPLELPDESGATG